MKGPSMWKPGMAARVTGDCARSLARFARRSHIMGSDSVIMVGRNWVQPSASNALVARRRSSKVRESELKSTPL